MVMYLSIETFKMAFVQPSLILFYIKFLPNSKFIYIFSNVIYTITYYFYFIRKLKLTYTFSKVI